jgi:hypothetical protein
MHGVVEAGGILLEREKSCHLPDKVTGQRAAADGRVVYLRYVTEADGGEKKRETQRER